LLTTFCNSNISVLDKIEILAGKRPEFVNVDVRDEVAISTLFEKYPIYVVIHFAGLKAVGESVEKPLLFYHNNVENSLCL